MDMYRKSPSIDTLLADLGRRFHARGWVLGTSGNFSAVVCRDPFRMTITCSGLDKGDLTPAHFVRVNAYGAATEGTGQPSAETALHLVAVRALGAGAVLHTHSVWGTIVSDLYSTQDGVCIQGYEMLKGLQGVSSHTHREWLPIIENDQDMARLARTVETILKQHPQAHGFLLRGHGLYTWGEDLAQAKRHVEIFEFLLEVIGRTRSTLAATSPMSAVASGF